MNSNVNRSESTCGSADEQISLAAPSNLGIIRDTNCIGANPGHVYVSPEEQVAKSQWSFNDLEVKQSDSNRVYLEQNERAPTNRDQLSSSNTTDRDQIAGIYFLNVLCDYLAFESIGPFEPHATLEDVVRSVLSKSESEFVSAKEIVVLDQAELEFLQHKLSDAFRIPYGYIHALFQDFSNTPWENLSAIARRSDQLESTRESLRAFGRKKCECPSQFDRLAAAANRAREHRACAAKQANMYRAQVYPGDATSCRPDDLPCVGVYDSGVFVEPPRQMASGFPNDTCRPVRQQEVNRPRVAFPCPVGTPDVPSLSELLRRGADSVSGFAKHAANSCGFGTASEMQVPSVTLNNFAKQVGDALHVLPFAPKEVSFSMTLKA
jgi:hypothetical protein